MAEKSPRRPELREVAAAVQRVAAAHQRYNHRVAAAVGLDSTALAALQTLTGEGRTPRQLEVALGVTSGTITAVIDRLEKHGLAERIRSTTDRRSLTVLLTSAGTVLASTIEEDYLKLLEGTDAGRRLGEVLENLNTLSAAVEAAASTSQS
jgi:DNA-binding MarR family transcriptional regulator